MSSHAQDYRNLTTQEYNAIKSLKNNKQIVIKKADKGSCIVIQNREDYIREGERQLSDHNFYTETEFDLTEEHSDDINKFINSLIIEHQLHQSTADYLTKDNNRTAQLYLLPKIHKSLNNPPGRPIVSGNGSPTEKISQLVDTIIKPFVPKIRSYVRDTPDFLEKLGTVGELPEGAILVSLDVSSLYTNIPHRECLRAVGETLVTHRDPSHTPSNDVVINLLRKVLQFNNFDFNGKHYLQVGGTAMGTRVAPSYANIFMDYFERRFVYTYRLQPLVWLRFIDDIFMIWTHGMEELLQFLNHLNSCHTSIKFTHECSTSPVNFLDIIVKLINNHIQTSLYTKPTDSHSYLRFDSDHAEHVCKSIPYSQFLRLRRNCSEFVDFLFHSSLLSYFLLCRLYPSNLILDGFVRTMVLDRRDLLKNSDRDTSQSQERKLFCLTTHNPLNPSLQKIISKHWPRLERCNPTRPLTQYQIIYGKRRNENLSDMLVRAKLPIITGNPDHVTGPPTCKNRRCTHCPRLDKSGNIKSRSNGKTFTAKKKVTCLSYNLVYCITCSSCGIQYIGETKNTIRERFNVHNSTIGCGYDSTVPRHYATHGDIRSPKYTIHVLEIIALPREGDRAKTLRLRKEQMWITNLNTLVLHGLNLDDQ